MRSAAPEDSDAAQIKCIPAPSQASPFDRLRARMREGTARAHSLEYYRHRRRPNLIRLIQQVALPEADALVALYRSCIPKRPCRTVTCPTCSEVLKARARDQALERIVERLGRFPQDFEVSFVTVDGTRTDLDVEAARAAMARFERQMDNFIRRHARTTGWFGLMDISTDGLVHLHALILHPHMPRNELEGRLKGSFPGPKQVKVSPWDRSLSLAENLQNVFNYSVVGDRHVGVVRRRNGPDRDITPTNAIDVVKRIVVVQTLAGRGLQGLRFIRNMKPLHKGIKVVELETLQRRTRRVRKNSKNMLNQPWAPRGEYGTHLGLSKNPFMDESQKMPITLATDERLEGESKRVTGATSRDEPEEMDPGQHPMN